MAEKNVSEVTYFVKGGTGNIDSTQLNSINQ